MNIAPELAAFIGRPPTTRSPKAKAVHGYAGLAHHGARPEPKPEPREATEEPMPRGVYQRKQKAENPPQDPAPKKRGTKRKAKSAPKARTAMAPNGARFGVFDDGTIELRLPTCTGLVKPAEAREFLGFLKRIGVE